jgi:hypothetical protein
MDERDEAEEPDGHIGREQSRAVMGPALVEHACENRPFLRLGSVTTAVPSQPFAKPHVQILLASPQLCQVGRVGVFSAVEKVRGAFSSPRGSPRQPSTPSCAISDTIPSTATGSAHHPNKALSRSPPRRTADREVHNAVCVASARIAALFTFAATRLFARARTGMTIKDANTGRIPTMLRCGGSYPRREESAS